MTTKEELPSLLAISSVRRGRANDVWGMAIFLQIAAIVAGGVVPLVWQQPGYGIAVTVAVAGTVATLVRWWSDTLRSSADKLFRKVEDENLFGWPVSRKTQLDELATSDIDAAATRGRAIGAYWASSEPPGPVRAAECVQESAWWSEHLARGVSTALLALCAVLAAGSFAVLFSVLGTAMDATQASTVAKAILSVLSVVFTGGLLRLAVEYNSFASSAADACSRAAELRDVPTVELVDAVRVLHDYQVARSKAPPIPAWYHSLRKDKLNSLWAKLGTRA